MINMFKHEIAVVLESSCSLNSIIGLTIEKEEAKDKTGLNV